MGYLLPEAAEGGMIAYLKDGDIIEIDVDKKAVNVIGFNNEKHSLKEVDAEFISRKASMPVKQFKHKGALKFLD